MLKPPIGAHLSPDTKEPAMNMRTSIESAAPAADTRREEHLIMFNTRAFNAVSPTDGASRYHRIDHNAKNGRLIGSLCGMIEGTSFTSGWGAPFGGPDFMRGTETVPNIGDLIDQALSNLRARGIKTVRILTKPTFHGQSEIYVTQALFQRGFQVEAAELNHHVDLGPVASPEDYLASLPSPSRQDVSRALKGPFIFEEAISDADICTAHNLLTANRTRGKRSRPSSLEYIRDLQAAFPGNIRWFLLKHKTIPVAAVLQYNITDVHAVIIDWGDDHNLQCSPMNLLAYPVFEQARADGLATVDIGLSSVNGVPNPDHVRFAESIGCHPGHRLNLVAHLQG